jgi:hypothetical protein
MASLTDSLTANLMDSRNTDSRISSRLTGSSRMDSSRLTDSSSRMDNSRTSRRRILKTNNRVVSKGL